MTIPLLTRLTKRCKRPERQDQMDPGAFYLAIGVGLPFLFFSPTAASIGLIHVCLADAAASVAGHLLPRIGRIPYSTNKSWTGSLAFILVATIGGMLYLPWYQALIIAGIGSALESFPPPDIDNITVPVGVALIVHLLGWA